MPKVFQLKPTILPGLRATDLAKGYEEVDWPITTGSMKNRWTFFRQLRPEDLNRKWHDTQWHAHYNLEMAQGLW